MTKEEKSLLLKDLSARWPYGVICEFNLKVYKLKGINRHKKLWWFEFDGFRCLDNIKPYLRPMSSMTEEERDELGKYMTPTPDNHGKVVVGVYLKYIDEVVDYFNKKMLDWRGLIKKGLALEAPEEMYKTV